jgi:hypothetical protein
MMFIDVLSLVVNMRLNRIVQRALYYVSRPRGRSLQYFLLSLDLQPPYQAVYK